MSISFYRAFEDRHRGSRELIRERQKAYFPLSNHSNSSIRLAEL